MKDHRSLIIALLLVLLSTPHLARSQATNQCVSLASTLKEYNISNQSSAFLNSTYDQYCEQNGEAKSTSAGVGLDFVIKSIPVKFTGNYGSASEGFKNFCKAYFSVVNSIERKYSYEERIASKALDTIESCLRIAASGASITHDVPNQASVNFLLTNGAATKIEVRGLSAIPPTGVNCSGQINGKVKAFGNSTYLRVDDTQSVVCTRLATNAANGKVVYDEQVITFSTNLGNYSVLLPREEKLPIDLANQIATRIGNLENINGKLVSRTAALEAGITTDVYRCPSGRSPGWNPGGPWGSYGCTGQISVESTCLNIEHPHHDVRQCTKIGKIRSF